MVNLSFPNSDAYRLPIMTEHEHGGFGASGLRRIRVHPPLRAPTSPSTASTSFKDLAGPRSSTMAVSLPSSRAVSSSSMGPASPEFSFGEDISRFPAESLHSFSFAHQSEEPIHSRQNLLRRSIEFIRDRPGWGASNPGIVSAQAKVSGDAEAQSMIELLARAKLLGQESDEGEGLGFLNGPLTGPAHLDGDSVFENAFLPTSKSPVELDDLTSEDPLTSIKEDVETEPSGSPGNPTRQMMNGDRISGSPTETTCGETSSSTKRSGTAKQKPPPLQRTSLKRTYTDISPLSLQNKLMEALAVPYVATDGANPAQLSPSCAAGGMNMIPPVAGPGPANAALHAHSSRWTPAAQAIFTTQATPPWTILAANDLACLVFGVTKAEVRRLGILEVVREERRKWLEEKLMSSSSDSSKRICPPDSKSQQASPTSTLSPSMGNGVTAQLLNKPSWRDRRAKTTEDNARLDQAKKKDGRGGNNNHTSHPSRGVLICGDVVPVQKRNGVTGSASLWVKEKRGGLIWVLEEITEDVAHLKLDDKGQLVSVTGASSAIWGFDNDSMTGLDVGCLLPRIPRKIRSKTNDVDYAEVAELRHFTARNADDLSSPVTIEPSPKERCLRVSSFPHIAGMMVISASDLKITSSNSVFSAALFGQAQPDGLSITSLIPGFDRLLRVFTEEDKVQLVDGLVLPEHSFRRARTLLAIREGEPDTVTTFLRPSGLLAKHRDGSDMKVDVQMRVVNSSSSMPTVEKNFIVEENEGEEGDGGRQKEPSRIGSSEVMYALWITYSRHLHATGEYPGATTPLAVRACTPPHQPSPGQTQGSISPAVMEVEEPKSNGPVAQVAEVIKEKPSPLILAEDIKANQTREITDTKVINTKSKSAESKEKKSIDDFVILEDMGQGAYGQVKLARYKKNQMKKMVLKYVTKRRILVDTWTRDRRLGTVPLEIHVLDYLRHDGLKHPNIVEMSDFFEDDINYYIEMVPHGLPGMDLFDYIELRVNMEEGECRSIFRQVANAVHHLHTRALVVHRDIKDENVVLDGEGNIKLIDFGSATYIKNGPFDVFVGTIGKCYPPLQPSYPMIYLFIHIFFLLDYAAPEVLAGHPYRGKEQDVWALGILLYTIVYKENPFYSIDEIMDHNLRVPYIMSEDCIHLIRQMLNRDLDQRIDIQGVVEHPWCGAR